MRYRLERPGQVLVGTWRLLAWEAQATDGTVSDPFGERAVGYLVFIADGRMLAQVMPSNRRSFADGDIPSISSHWSSWCAARRHGWPSAVRA